MKENKKRVNVPELLAMYDLDKIDDLVDYIRSHRPEGAVLVKNDERFDEIQEAVMALKELVKTISPDGKVSIYPDEITGSSITFKLIADEIIVDDSKSLSSFCSALNKASNFEVYPRTDGTIAFAVVFQNAFKAAPPIKN